MKKVGEEDGRKEKKTMDQLSIKMWVRKNDKKYGSLHHKNVSKKNYIRKF